MPLIRVLNYGLMEPFSEKTGLVNDGYERPPTLANSPFLL